MARHASHYFYDLARTLLPSASGSAACAGHQPCRVLVPAHALAPRNVLGALA
jgi:hypothetical protein